MDNLKQVVDKVKSVTHQFNNELCIVSAACQLLVKCSEIPESDKENMRHLIKSAHNVSHLLANLSDQL